MNKILPKLLIPIAIFLISCREIECDQLPKTYSSYNAAIKTIKAAHFNFRESIKTSKSSWVREASYYSCNGMLGFFILKTDNQEYLYANVPIEIWKNFKNANSFGSYFNHNIKNKFTFKLNP